MRHTSLPTLTLALTLLGAVACDALQSGKENNLAFELVATDRLIPVSFNTPLATGFSIDVAAYAAGSARTPAPVTLARSTNLDVARVPDAPAANRFTVQARRAGTTTVEVVSPSGNDAFDLQVADVTAVTLTYPGPLLSPATPPVRVVLGGTARFGVTLKGDGDRTLIGYGPFPVTFTPEGAATAEPTTSTAHLAVRFDALGVVTLTPRGADPLEVTVVAPEDVETLTLVFAGEPLAIAVGGKATAILEARDDENLRILGLTGVAAVATTTPTVCQLTQSFVLGDASFELLGLAPGGCTVAATLGTLEVTATLEVE